MHKQQILPILPGIPSATLKSEVLNAVYDLAGLKLLDGHKFLVAEYRKTNVGIFVIDGDFSREHFKQAFAEAKAAGLRTSRMYVYGITGTYSGSGICFSKFEEIGVGPTYAKASSSEQYSV